MQGRTAQSLLRLWQKEWPRTLFKEQKGKTPAMDRADILLVGTKFRCAVWKQLLKIKPGQPISYGEMAQRLGKPGAARAVGGALRANPVPYLVPCHRVIAADGSLGGFAGTRAPRERKIKSALLESEGFFIGKRLIH